LADARNGSKGWVGSVGMFKLLDALRVPSAAFSKLLLCKTEFDANSAKVLYEPPL